MHIPEEFDKKIRLSLSTLVAIIGLTFTVSGVIVKVLDNDTQRLEQRQYLEHRIEELQAMLLGEVDGHRKDEDRRYNETINPRLNKIENKIK